MHVLRHVGGGADFARDGDLRVDELAGAGNEGDGADARLERVDGAVHLEGELRDAVAEVGERQALEHDVGDAAVGRRVAGTFLGFDEAVGGLRLAPRIEAVGEGCEVELLAVGPDAAHAGDLALGHGDGEAGVVAVLGGSGARALADGALAAAAALGGGDHLLLEVGGPDDLSADACAAVKARDGRTLRGACDAQFGEAGAIERARLARGAEQRAVDERAGEGADLRADGRAGERGAEDGDAGGQQGAADGGAGNGEGEGGHDSGEVVSGEWSVVSGQW